MITINITEEVNNHLEMADTLRYIADLLERGYTSGYAPNWIVEED